MLNFIIIAYVFSIGIILGSFFNVCIYRIPKGESVVNPPSHCGNCNTRLKPLDLIPVFSYIFLKGKCRHCGEKYSARYAVVELVTGIIFAALYIKYDFTFEFLKYCVLASFLIVIGLIDFDTTDVYFSTTIGGIISGAIFIAAGYFLGGGITDYIYGALLGGGVITAIILLTKGMGWGDVEICAIGGIFLGLKLTIVMLFFSFIFGSVIGILLIVTKKKSRKDYIPFGPFIAMAAIFAVFFGERIIKWYL
jgi:leader peptidase (prepilin peptidase) / N-methyltransferase